MSKAGGIDFGFALAGIAAVIVCLAICVGCYFGGRKLKDMWDSCSMPELPKWRFGDNEDRATELPSFSRP